jgi:hypothetical protein
MILGARLKGSGITRNMMRRTKSLGIWPRERLQHRIQKCANSRSRVCEMYTSGTIVRRRMLALKWGRMFEIVVVVVVNPSRAMCPRSSCRELDDDLRDQLHSC